MQQARDPWQEAKELIDGRATISVCDGILRAADAHVAWHESGISLDAARNLMSPRSRALMASGLMEKVSGGGWIGTRHKSGHQQLDLIEAALVLLARKLFRAEHVEYRLPTGSIANGVFLLASTRPGDVIMALSPRHGGHVTFSQGAYATAMGVRVEEVPCNDDDAPQIDLARLEHAAVRLRPRWIVVGSTFPLFPDPIGELHAIAHRAGAALLYDAAHVFGLIAGGRFQDPLREGADAITTSTQKTFPGPVGGLILTNDVEVGDAVRRAASTLIGNYYNNRAAALAVTLAEMLEFGSQYAEQTVRNAQHLAGSLEAEGFRILGADKGYTHSHVVVINVSGIRDASRARQRLEAARVTCDAIPLPSSHPRAVAIRLGSLAVTRRGMSADEMTEIAVLLRRVVLDEEDPAVVMPDVVALATRFPDLHYCFPPPRSMAWK